MVMLAAWLWLLAAHADEWYPADLCSDPKILQDKIVIATVYTDDGCVVVTRETEPEKENEDVATNP